MGGGGVRERGGRGRQKDRQTDRHTESFLGIENTTVRVDLPPYNLE